MSSDESKLRGATTTCCDVVVIESRKGLSSTYFQIRVGWRDYLQSTLGKSVSLSINGKNFTTKNNKLELDETGALVFKTIEQVKLSQIHKKKKRKSLTDLFSSSEELTEDEQILKTKYKTPSNCTFGEMRKMMKFGCNDFCFMVDDIRINCDVFLWKKAEKFIVIDMDTSIINENLLKKEEKNGASKFFNDISHLQGYKIIYLSLKPLSKYSENSSFLKDYNYPNGPILMPPNSTFAPSMNAEDSKTYIINQILQCIGNKKVPIYSCFSGSGADAKMFLSLGVDSSLNFKSNINSDEISDSNKKIYKNFTEKGINEFHIRNKLFPQYSHKNLTSDELSIIFSFVPLEDTGVVMTVNKQWNNVYQNVLTGKRTKYAKKLGLSELDFIQEPKFYQFLENNFLHKMILYYEHKFDQKNIQLLFNGKLYDWNSFEKFLKLKSEAKEDDFEKFVVVDENLVLQNALYTHLGIQIKPNLKKIELEKLDVTKTGELDDFVKNGIIVLKILNRAPKINYLNVKVERSINKHVRNRGDHSWIQLVSEEGYIFSFGALWEHYSIKDMQVANFKELDQNEFYCSPGGEIVECKFKLSREEFGRYLIENLCHVRDQDVIYHMTRSNCTSYALRFTEKLNYNLNSDMSVLNHVGKKPGILEETFGQFIPKEVKDVVNVTLMTIPNFVASSVHQNSLTDKLQKKLENPEMKDKIYQTNSHLFFLNESNSDIEKKIETTSKFMKETYIDGKSLQIASPYKLSLILDEINQERIEKNDEWYVNEKYINN
eukprot:gene9499-1705_t